MPNLSQVLFTPSRECWLYELMLLMRRVDGMPKWSISRPSTETRTSTAGRQRGTDMRREKRWVS
jgi:hypothetical protein